MQLTDGTDYQLVLTTNCGEIVIDTYADKAPETVNAMLWLAGEGYFDSTLCHRLVTEGINVLQCGDPTATGTGGPGFELPDENLPAEDGVNYPAGTVAMANAGPGTSGSQFFLVYEDTTLPPNYTIWGEVSSGLDIVDEDRRGRRGRGRHRRHPRGTHRDRDRGLAGGIAPGPDHGRGTMTGTGLRRGTRMTEHAYGRVDDDGTVYVRRPDGQEVAVGQWAAGAPAEGLAFFERKYDGLKAEAELLQARLKDGKGTPENVTIVVGKLRDAVENPHVVGDLAVLAGLAEELEAAGEARKEAAAAAREETRIKTMAARTAHRRGGRGPGGVHPVEVHRRPVQGAPGRVDGPAPRRPLDPRRRAGALEALQHRPLRLRQGPPRALRHAGRRPQGGHGRQGRHHRPRRGAVDAAPTGPRPPAPTAA